jgi:hypothetical protein
MYHFNPQPTRPPQTEHIFGNITMQRKQFCYARKNFLAFRGILFALVVTSASVRIVNAGSVDPAAAIQLAIFDVDATPPLGSQMAYNTAVRHADLSLRSRGIVVLGAGDPIVMAAVDWIGIGNAAHTAFRDALAGAAGTSPARVAVHALHQHDAPQADFTAERLLADMDIHSYKRFQGDFAREVIRRTATALQEGLAKAVPLTHVGFGRGRVQGVASNRRLIGDNGRIRGWRASATRDEALRAEPEGIIDPFVATLVLWSENTPAAVLSCYATHPMSYYRTGVPGPDFPGIARLLRTQDVPSALHLHFTGAGGNVAAGKYNDGSPENRVTLALRLAAGMRAAYEAAHVGRRPLLPEDIGWHSEPVRLNVRPELDRMSLEEGIRAHADRGTMNAADALAWMERSAAGTPIDITCLRIGDVRMLHMPGELFVEYQLAAQNMRPDLHVMMAAYGDYGPGYIGTAESYAQGGYEVDIRSSFVGPQAEETLTTAMRRLLEQAP